MSDDPRGGREVAEMDDAEFEARWWRALMHCIGGHPDGCTFGGMSTATSYWIYQEGCPENHGERCDICGAKAVTDFRGTVADDDHLYLLWRVMCCRGCSDREKARHPAAWLHHTEAARP